MKLLIVILLGALMGCGSSRVQESDAEARLLDEADYVSTPDTAPAPEPVQPVPAPVAAEIAGPGEIRRADLNRVLDAGPAAILAKVITEPYREKGRFAGFRITEFVRGDPALIDLKPGDVVRLVNGRKIERPEDFYELFQALRVASDLTFEIKRGGAEILRTYPIVD
jgi:type II secretory pathway component PulC